MPSPIRFVLAVILFSSAASFSPLTAQTVKSSKIQAETHNPVVSLIAFATKHLHIPYRPGGQSKTGFDCSGFVRYCFEKWNITLPHSSAAQARHGEAVKLDDARPGDVIFFKGSSTKSDRIGHVGIITDVAPGYVRFIHSAWQGGIRYDLLHANYYEMRFVAIKRMID